MMSTASHFDDDSLIDELRKATAASQSVPDRVREAGYAAWAWRNIDLELEHLSLVHDSAVQSSAGLRSDHPEAPRVLVFESGDLTLEVEVGTETIMGRVVPANPERIILDGQDGEVLDSETDDAGFFLLPRPSTTPVRLKVVGHERPLVTDWFPI